MMVPVLNIRKVGVFVGQDSMLMRVRMRRRSVSLRYHVVSVLVVLVMRVAVFMGRGVVRVKMGVMLGQVQPNAYGH